MLASSDWSTLQLTQFLAAVSARAESDGALLVGLERAAEALEAEVAAFIQNGRVVASVGFPVGRVPEAALVAAAEAGTGSVVLPDLGSCRTAVVRADDPLPGRLLLARSGEEAFTHEDVNLLAGMMRLLQLNHRMLEVIERERTAKEEARRQAELNAGLLSSLEERHRLLERLSRLQRSISHRDPLPEVLDAVTAGASELFGAGVEVALRLFDPRELVGRPAPSHPAAPRAAAASSADRVAGWRAIANESLAIVDAAALEAPPASPESNGHRTPQAPHGRGEVRTAMAAPVYQEGKVVGSLVVSSRVDGRRYTESEQEALLSFAEHASLALTDAATLDAVRRQTGLLALLESVAVSANEAATFAEAVQTCMDLVCAYAGWPLGYAYARGSGAGGPVPRGGHVDPAFARAGAGLEPIRREVAAEVMATGKPVCRAIPALEPPGGPRRSGELSSVFAFPVLAGRDVVAALEFFAAQGREPNVELRESLAQVGTQIGRVVERSRAAAALQVTTERTRRIIEAAKDAFVSVDIADRIVDFNHAAELTFGWSRDEAMGKTVAELIIPMERRDSYRRGFEKYLKQGSEPASVVMELTAAHRDGHRFPIECAVWPVRVGDTWEFNAFARDISDRKRAERELADARDASLEASRLKSAFLATMSHEIRTPMNGILGMTRLLLDTDLDADQRECAEGVERSAQALLTIINDILDISKIEAGRLELERTEFALGPLVADVADLLGRQAREKGLRLTTSVGSGVPRYVRSDPGRLRQILMNLVGNAVKFTDDGAVAVRARVVAQSEHTATVRFEVADTGIGILKATQEHIFEAFRQADASTTRRFGGTGLGLAITRQLVGLMGGEIVVESTPGAGSTFSFTIPFERAAGVPEPAPPAAAGTPTVPRGARVLVAEDNPVNKQILVKALERAGYIVDVRSTGLEAVQAVTEGPFHAVLMDCQMPEMDGYEATRLVRLLEGSGRHTPIIAITASAMSSDRDQCLAAGMDDFVSKPVRPEDLLATLARWVRAEPGDEVPASRASAADAATPVPATAAVDAHVIQDLRQSLGPRGDAIFRELVDVFLDDAPLSLQGIRAAASAGDAELFGRAAHRLKGSAASFGADRLTELCATAEALGAARDLDRAKELVGLISEEYRSVEQALRLELAQAG